MESLKGLARMFNSLADSLDDSKDNEDPIDDRVDALMIEENGEQTEEYIMPKRDRSGSVDSGIGDCEFDPETGLEVICLDEVSY